MKKQGRFSTKMIILIPVFVIGIILYRIAGNRGECSGSKKYS